MRKTRTVVGRYPSTNRNRCGDPDWPKRRRLCLAAATTAPEVVARWREQPSGRVAIRLA